MNATFDNMISLTELLAGIMPVLPSIEDVNITGVTLDSRMVQAGSLFISLAKDEQQRSQYLVQALNSDAAVVLFEESQVFSLQDKSVMDDAKVKAYGIVSLESKVSEIAARFYDHPSQQLTVIAVTGTNGKTSVSQFIAQALESLGFACGVVGTLGVGRTDNLQSTGMTTPDPVTLQAVLATFCKQSIEYVVIEASSHALEQGRLNSVAVDVAVFTNLSRDHLDYHQDMADYAAAKQRLFEFLSVKAAVINGDDLFGKTLIKALAGKDLELLSYSSQRAIEGESKAITSADKIKTSAQGVSFTVENEQRYEDIDSPLLGRFNVDNLLAALTALMAIGINFNQAVKAVAQCQAIEGRMQSYGGEQQPQVVIDFAHTPDALIQVLQTLRPHLLSNGHLWCVFGCGGDRDKGKRQLMAVGAEQNADQVVITDDNPRSENNIAIVEDILIGFKHPQQVHVEHDRQLAITYAVTHANRLDIVLIAGKGHEQYQEISGIKHHFSDAEAVNIALQAANDDNHSLVGAKQ